MIDDTVKSIMRGARDAKTLDECNMLRVRVDAELGDNGAVFACLMAIREREDVIIASYKYEREGWTTAEDTAHAMLEAAIAKAKGEP